MTDKALGPLRLRAEPPVSILKTLSPGRWFMTLWPIPTALGSEENDNCLYLSWSFLLVAALCMEPHPLPHCIPLPAPKPTTAHSAGHHRIYTYLLRPRETSEAGLWATPDGSRGSKNRGGGKYCTKHSFCTVFPPSLVLGTPAPQGPEERRTYRGREDSSQGLKGSCRHDMA